MSEQPESVRKVYEARDALNRAIGGAYAEGYRVEIGVHINTEPGLQEGSPYVGIRVSKPLGPVVLDLDVLVEALAAADLLSEEEERETKGSPPSEHLFTPPTGRYCAICGYDIEAHTFAPPEPEKIERGHHDSSPPPTGFLGGYQKLTPTGEPEERAGHTDLAHPTDTLGASSNIARPPERDE